MTIAVIPARGGSRRIPRKNIRPFLGKPIIAWSLDAARESGMFDHIIVSTDDEEIAAVARQWGAEVPFLRPKELADDHTGTMPVVAHAVRWAQEQGWPADPVCCIYATAPFITPEDLKRGHELLMKSGKVHAFTVTPFPYPVQRALRITDDGGVEMFQPQHFHSRSQDLEPAWHDAGQFYWSRMEAVLHDIPVFSCHAVPVEVPPHRVQDIDTEEDWVRAEILMRILLEMDKKPDDR